MVKSIVKALFTTLDWLIKSLVDIFCKNLEKSVGDAVPLGSLGGLFNVDIALYGMIICFSEGVAYENGEVCNTSEEVIDQAGEEEITGLEIHLSTWEYMQ